jgi:hypothetical protein
MFSVFTNTGNKEGEAKKLFDILGLSVPSGQA